MAFAGNCGLDVDVSPATKLAAAEAGSVDPCLAALFNEEVCFDLRPPARTLARAPPCRPRLLQKLLSLILDEGL